MLSDSSGVTPDHFVAEGENQSNIRLMLIEAIHEMLGHAGTDKTWSKLRKSVYWPLMYDDVKGYCQTCDTCQRNKQSTTKPAGPARTMPIPSRPWESIAIDFMGPFNTSNGFKNIMVIQDRFSSSIIIEPLPDKYAAKDVADVMFKRYYGHYGFPESILSDRDPRFLSAFWKGLHDILNVKLIFATAFHQQTNGQIERANKTIGQMLRIYTNNNQEKWTTQLWRIEHAFNFGNNTSINGKTPFEIQYGHTPINLPDHWTTSNTPAVNEYLEQMKTDNKIAWDALMMARYRQNKYATKRRTTTIQYYPGDLVMYQRRSRAKGKVKKLQTIWMGPYAVLRVDENTGNCTLDLPRSARKHNVFATDKLKKYHANDTHKPWEPINEDEDMPDSEDTAEYEVDRILGKKQMNGIDHWLVKWKGYNDDDNTWEPHDNVRDTAPEAIIEYLSRLDDYETERKTMRPRVTVTNARNKTNNIPIEDTYPSDDTFCSSNE
jgi:hypothetical protein